MKMLNSIILSIEKKYIRKLQIISDEIYMNHFTRYLKKIGIKIKGTPKYINSDVYFDSKDYTKISIGNNITISREVMFLTHDYSITTAFAALGEIIERGKGEVYFLKEISVGDNCFIGARASILPGTSIGNNVIIGSGSVVKGIIPDNSIVVGNPCKIIKKTDEYAAYHKKKKEYFIEN